MTATRSKWRLWYNQPAEDWNEALPVGNGKMGAMVFGGIVEERLALNEDSLWSGKPHDDGNTGVLQSLEEVRGLLFAGKYAEAHALAEQRMVTPNNPHYGNYHPLGDMYIQLELPDSEVSDYCRELDLNEAVCRTSYRMDGVQYTREVISSFPDQVLVVRLEASHPVLKGSVQLNRERGVVVNAAESQGLIMQGIADLEGVGFAATLEVRTEQGSCYTANDLVFFEDCQAVTIYLSASTTYRYAEPQQVNEQVLQRALQQQWKDLKQTHIADYQKLFNRMELDLGADKYPSLPTDERLTLVKEGKDDVYLTALYVQYGRYLLIASSRPGTLPANLQGIWNESYTPPWFSDYTININTQMNYWHAETCNLSELQEPLFDLLDALIEPGRETARSRYDCAGIALSTRTNPWFNTSLRATSSLLWQDGAAWLSRHYWEHYLFTGNRQLLEQRGYPFMKEAALFYIDFMVEHPKYGWLVSGPATSPENRFRALDGTITALDMSPTMTVQIIDDLFDNCIRASEELGLDVDFRELLRQKRAKLPPMQIGKHGQLQEWLEDHEEIELGHRHVSHLFGLFPGHSISEEKPELLHAVKIALDRRLQYGGGHTGWSCAWIINLWAHLGDGDKAKSFMDMILTKSTYNNLFDTHPPFQIDGNFGAAAGVIEMLVQSDEKGIRLLPALPTAWSTGSIQGVRARGGFELSMQWASGKLSSLVITSQLGKRCSIQYPFQTYDARVFCDEVQVAAELNEGSISFDTEGYKTYTLKL